MLERLTSPQKTEARRRRLLAKRIVGGLLTGATAFGISACSNTESVSAIETPASRTVTTTESPTEASKSPEVVDPNVERVTAGTKRMIESAMHGADKATMQENVAMWGNEKVVFRAEFSDEGALQVLSAGPVDENADQTQGFQLEFSTGPCQSDNLPFCVNELSLDDMVSGIASFADGGSSANVYIKKEGNNLSYQVTEGQGNSTDPERASWLWNDISEKLYTNTTTDIASAKTPPVETAPETAEVKQAPESLDIEVSELMQATVTSLLESFRDPGFEPRVVDNYTISNMPEGASTIDTKNRTFGTISMNPTGQNLTATISRFQDSTYSTVAFGFDMTRTNPAISAEHLNNEVVEQAFANIGKENAQIALHNMYFEVYKFGPDGLVSDEARLDVLPVMGGEGYTTNLTVPYSTGGVFGPQGYDITDASRAARVIDAANIFSW